VRYVDNIVSVFRLGGASSDGKGECVKAIEREISRYIHDREFSTIELIKHLARATIKRSLSRIMGESLYYRLVLYSAHRVRRHFAR
jgi:hypothetical protein